MKTILISLSVWVTLTQTTDHRNNGQIRTGEKTSSWLNNLISGDFKNKYFGHNREKDESDFKIARGKAKTVQRARESQERLNKNPDFIKGYVGKENSRDNSMLRWGYHVDPVLNEVRRSRGENSDSKDTDSPSSSREFNDWKTEWKQLWLKKKLEVVNQTDPGGDRVNMVAARPWGVSCGDPAQHDMPWGTCVLPAECNAEYRIYRGDYFCGRTQFICCSLIFNTYDLYQGFDVSLQRSSMETDSADKRERAKRKSSKEAKRKNARKKRRRKRMRDERKRKIKRTITKIVKEVRKILNRAYRNGTKIRKRKTKTMKKFIKFLKKQYKMDRDSAKDIHENMMFDIDQDLMNRLMQIKDFNSEFMTNSTFRSIIVNRTMSFKAARMLTNTYPDLVEFMPSEFTRRRGDTYLRRGGSSRRGGDASRGRGDGIPPRRDSARLQPRRRKYLDYDVEYGLLYN